MFDWGDGTYSDWLGPYNSGTTVEETNTWEIPDTYDICVKAKDINNKESDWSEPLTVTINANQAPGKPTVDGPKLARAGKPLTFTFVANDPEGHDVFYWISWGDGDIEDYIGPYASGEEIEVTHTYNEGGSFSIITKAMDFAGEKGPQAQYKLTIIKNRAVENSFLFKIIEKLVNQFPILERLFG